MLELLVSMAELEAVFRAWWDNAIVYIPQIALGIGVFFLFTLLASLGRAGAKRAFSRASEDPRAGNAWGTIVNYVILLLGIVAALAVAGVELSALMIAVGAMGFGVAFALQDTLANFFAGLILLTARPFGRDDAVKVNGAEGKVQRIDIRATKLRTFDGLKVEVPNKAVIGDNITVYSEHPTRRFDIGVGIGYDDDITGAVATAKEAAGTVEDVLDDPAPEVFVSELGGSSVNLTVRFWVQRTDRATMLQIKGEVTQAVKEALVADGYDIPYPIRTVFMHEET